MANDKAPLDGDTKAVDAPQLESEKINSPDTLERVKTNQTDVPKEVLKQDLVASLGIPDWEAKQKRVVRVLDMTLLPQLWILYMFNYLNRTNIA